MTDAHENALVVVRSAQLVYVNLLLATLPDREIWSNEDATRLLNHKGANWTVYYQPELDIATMVPHRPDVGPYVEGPPPQPSPQENTQP